MTSSVARFIRRGYSNVILSWAVQSFMPTYMHRLLAYQIPTATTKQNKKKSFLFLDFDMFLVKVIR